MALEFGSYKVQDVGKLIKDTKRVHIWILYYENKRYEIVAKESFVSKKFRFYIQRNLIQEMKKVKEIDKRKGFDFEYQNLYIKVRKADSKKYDLYINNQKFERGKTIQTGDAPQL